MLGIVDKKIKTQHNSALKGQTAPISVAKPAVKNSINSIPLSYSNSIRAYALAFTGTGSFETDVVKEVKNKEYSGLGLYKKNQDGSHTDYIDWGNKVGWDQLKKEPINWEKASNKEIHAFWHALALAETNDTTWPRRFNPINVKEPLATYRTLVSPNAKKAFVQNLQELSKISPKEAPFLDKPIVNPQTGKLNFSFTVFDTETTGINTVAKRPVIGAYESEQEATPVDKIIQIGAVKFDKNGEIVPESALSQLVNPERHIPEGATAVHGIHDEDVADKPVMNSLLKEFNKDYLKNDAIVAYNSKFDMALLNNSIDDYNSYFTKKIDKRKESIVIDPFVLVQRIHPYLGAKKQLSEQYKFLFGQNVDGAHDAFADVKATSDVLKYCLYYLDAKAKKNGKTLTVRDVLKFQWGHEVEGIGVKLNQRGVNASKNFKESYRKKVVGVDNFQTGFAITAPTKMSPHKPDTLAVLKPLIGDQNIEILKKGGIVNTVIDNFEDGHFQEPQETTALPNSTMVNSQYVMVENFKNVLMNIGIQPYNENSKEDVIDTIVQHSKHYIKEDYIDIWMKNPKPDSAQKGNDLPEIDVSRKVMLERIDSDKKAAEIPVRELKDVIK